MEGSTWREIHHSNIILIFRETYLYDYSTVGTQSRKCSRYEGQKAIYERQL